MLSASTIQHLILLVEDDENDVFLFTLAAKKAGIQARVKNLSDGKQALDYLDGDNEFDPRDARPLPSLILLDLKLPFVNGLEVLRSVRDREALRHIPVVILTSSMQENDIANAYRLGANSYLVKPSTSGELVSLVKVIDDYWIGQNILPVHLALQSEGMAGTHSRVDASTGFTLQQS